MAWVKFVREDVERGGGRYIGTGGGDSGGTEAGCALWRAGEMWEVSG